MKSEFEVFILVLKRAKDVAILNYEVLCGMALKNKNLTSEQIRIRKYALDLAKSNKLAEPNILRIYWFPNEKEIRLVEIEEHISHSTSENVEPFYFDASPRDLLLAPSAIALIHTDEENQLKLPEDWGAWENAEIWHCETYEELLNYDKS